jgi:hypothetical protein
VGGALLKERCRNGLKRRRLPVPILLGVIAIIIAVAGSTVAVSTAKKKKKTTAVSYVTQAVALPAQTTNNGIFEEQVDCPGGTQVLGGGITIAQTEQLDPAMSESGPRGNGWHVATDLDITTPQPATLTAICFRK